MISSYKYLHYFTMSINFVQNVKNTKLTSILSWGSVMSHALPLYIVLATDQVFLII